MKNREPDEIWKMSARNATKASQHMRMVQDEDQDNGAPTCLRISTNSAANGIAGSL